MPRTRNILFVMSDQLRFDYLSCMGHPTLETPHIDALAARGVLFTHAWCNDPVCGPSRMSFYTGRYAFSHGATYNNFPLRADEVTLGDYMRPLGLRTAVVGKTHMQANLAGMRRLGIDPASPQGILIGECGFEPFERDDGLHPNEALDPGLRYNRYLRGLGYDSSNPWHDFANSAEGEDGSVLSGWQMRHASRPARVAEEHSETAYMTDRAMDFIERAGDEPWCLHLSYIKPHWPYMAPAPYHDMFGPDAVTDPVRAECERADPNPVVAAFMAHSESVAFAREEVRATVIPAYMGLVKQLDDHIGRLMAFLSERGLLDDTMIVFTSDHGDYLGDHWLGEKELFHEQSVRIPLIVVDPGAQADATRGSRTDIPVESIDLIPTFLDALGAQIPSERLEGRSLMPAIRGERAEGWRDAVFAECDFSVRPARHALGISPPEARGFMVRTADWKYVEWLCAPPQLFDLRDDPDECRDLGRDPGYGTAREEMRGRLLEWTMRRRLRPEISDEAIAMRTGKAQERGFRFGVW